METIYEIVRVKQVVAESQIENNIVRSPEDGAELAYEFIGEDASEVLFVMCLNTKNRVIAVHRCHVGSLSASIVHSRDVFRSAIMNNSASVMIAHQHPSGDPMPSQEDINITDRLNRAGQILGIQLLDSLVIGERRNGKTIFTSLKEKGYL